MMKNLTLINIANSCGGKLYCQDDNIANTEVSAIVTDNRQVTKDSMFIAIPGEKVDGHDFIEDAYNKGAMAVIAEHELDIDKPYIVVENSLIAIKAIATFYRQQLDIKVVGITGSVGKTSTKETIYSVLSQKYNTLKTNGNFNNELGLPLTIFRLRDEHEIAVLEM
jgi:UDP-N-acetylmuramoyl-tripeptide--D-alanyl-D-alanine ligase